MYPVLVDEDSPSLRLDLHRTSDPRSFERRNLGHFSDRGFFASDGFGWERWQYARQEEGKFYEKDHHASYANEFSTQCQHFAKARQLREQPGLVDTSQHRTALCKAMGTPKPPSPTRVGQIMSSVPHIRYFQLEFEIQQEQMAINRGRISDPRAEHNERHHENLTTALLEFERKKKSKENGRMLMMGGVPLPMSVPVFYQGKVAYYRGADGLFEPLLDEY